MLIHFRNDHSTLFIYIYTQFFHLFLFGWVLGLRCYAGFSLVAARRGYSRLRGTDFSLCWPLLLWSTASGARASGVAHAGSAVALSGLSGTGSVVGARGLSCPTSTWDLPRPHVSCVARQIPHCWTTREAPSWADFGENSWSTLTCMNTSGQLCSSSPELVFSEIMGRHCWVLCLECPTCPQWNELGLSLDLNRRVDPLD